MRSACLSDIHHHAISQNVGGSRFIPNRKQNSGEIFSTRSTSMAGRQGSWALGLCW